AQRRLPPRAARGDPAPGRRRGGRSRPVLHARHAALRNRRCALYLAEPDHLRCVGGTAGSCCAARRLRSAMSEELIVGLVSVSDRASAGVYKDEGIPALKEWLASAIASPAWRDETRLIADEQQVIEKT